MKYLVTLLSIFVLNISTKSQALKSFTETKVGYLAEITTMFESAGKEDEINFLYEFFVPKWKEINAEDERFIYDISNLFLKKQFKASPHFYQFLSSYYYFSEGKGGGNLDKWKTIIEGLAQGRSKPQLEKYLESVFLLLKDNEIYHSNAISWSVSGDTYELINDSVPAIKFTNTVLTGKTKGDYTNILETSGIYYPTSYSWIGTSGKMNWEKAGLDVATNYVDFKRYDLNINSSTFLIDSATLHCEFYKVPLLGKIREKVLSASPQSVDYPIFDSYTKEVKIENILPNVDYYGGFSLRGSRFAGIGSPGEPSKLIFKQNKKPFLEAYSLDFIFDTANVVAPMAKIIIRLGNDSLVHSGLKFRYDKSKDLVELIKDDRSGSSGPMYSSYHEIDFFVEKLSWVNGDSLIELGTLRGSANNVATFESNNFFVTERYKALQFPGGQHPLYQIRNYCLQNKEKEFTVEDYSNFINADIPTTKQLLIDLANKGFIYYDFDSETAVVKDKLFDFLLANQKKIDYDVILFDSQVKSSIQPNATLNIKNYDLNVFGVTKIGLSETQAVAFFADKRTPYITIQKNRNIRFAGILRAGGFDFYGDSFLFNYDKFKVDLLKVDSVMLYVKRTETDSAGTTSRFIPVQSKIHNITGELYIDNPINKSGLDTLNNKEFPILKTNESSFAYYDKSETYDGIYNREKFYFKIDPFLLDSLDNFNQDVLRLKGALVSGGIFPDIIDSLGVQDDYSLGFKHKTPPNGLPLYGSKANFTNEIKLSDKGLMGNGDIAYVTSISSSPRFTFFPDSTTGIAAKMVNKKQAASPDVPEVNAKDFDFKLDPIADQLIANTLKSKFDLFANDGHLIGGLLLTPAGLSGSGKLDMFEGELTANKFRFNNSNAFADTASFKLNSTGDKNLAISTEKVSAQMDFNYRIGTFKALSGEAKIKFPKNQYVATMDTYKWLVDNKEVELTNSVAMSDTTEGAGSRFVSLHPDQDSLSFRVPRAIYDVNKYEIKCEGVQRILVADVIIQPDHGKVKILPNAVIETLQQAEITADYINRFHTIYNATVEIYSANKYLGKGDYNYEDDLKNKQKISFATISVDSTRHTFAQGKIPEDMNFKLNQHFDYRGEVMLKAEDRGLFFNGSTRILTTCDKIERNWLAFNGQVDPKDVLIPVGAEMKSDLGQALGAGIMLQTGDSASIYPTFISGKIFPKDTQITTALGYLWYDQESASYNIGSKNRFKKEGLEGNIVTLNTTTCDITANGSLGFGTPLGQVVTSMVGNAKYTYNDNSMQMNGLLMVDFMFDKNMLEYLSTKAVNYPFIQPVNISTTQYEKALTDYAPKERADLMDLMAKKGVMGDIPNGMKKSLVFADVKFKWDVKTESFLSVGNLGMLSALDNPLLVYLNGKIQISRSRRGNEIVMYFEFDPSTWYFFKYKFDENPRMQFYSSDTDFMKLFEGIKDKDKEMNTKKDEAAYKYEIAPRTSKDSFFERFE